MTADSNHKSHVVIIGGGITGLAAAVELATSTPDVSITILERNDRIGGVIQASPFAGLPSVDESADAFLLRSPAALELASLVGLGDDLVHPATGEAYIWHDELHDIPAHTVLGVPASLRSIWSTPIYSPRGKLRASIEPLLPRSRGRSSASLGEAIRARCGDEVLERVVDPLVGGIYATDTDAFSVHGMPQLDELIASRGSLMAGARHMLSTRREAGPVFGAPRGGMSSLVTATADFVRSRGATIRLNAEVNDIRRNDSAQYVVVGAHGELVADSVIVATPAKHSAPFLRTLSVEASEMLASREHASIVMVTLAVSRQQWPEWLTGSGYLVTKPKQTAITAASFASNKWTHLRGNDDVMILRVSLGRDGMPMHHHDDETLVRLALADLNWHLDCDLEPHAQRVTRWVESFPQYRPGHETNVAQLDSQLLHDALGVVLAGASYRGIGIPACIADGRRAARLIAERMTS
jgi:oxygen-dependent protoporphyrinogen oxidase